MADKEPFESLTGIAQQTADQITQQTKVAMENYLTWFQNAMSASQWGNVDLNRKLLSYAAENVTAAVGRGGEPCWSGRYRSGGIPLRRVGITLIELNRPLSIAFSGVVPKSARRTGQISDCSCTL